MKFSTSQTVYATQVHHQIKPGEENQQLEWVLQLDNKAQLSHKWLFAVIEDGCYTQDPQSGGLGWCFDPSSGELTDQLMDEGLVGHFSPTAWAAGQALTVRLKFIIQSGCIVVPQITIGEQSYALPAQVISPTSELYFITGSPALSGQAPLAPSSALQVKIGPTHLRDTQIIIPRGPRYETVMDEMQRMEVTGHSLFIKPVAAEPFPQPTSPLSAKTTSKIYITPGHSFLAR